MLILFCLDLGKNHINRKKSVKDGCELDFPLSREVTRCHEALSEIGVVNTSCYELGWLIKIKRSKHTELH